MTYQNEVVIIKWYISHASMFCNIATTPIPKSLSSGKLLKFFLFFIYLGKPNIQSEKLHKERWCIVLVVGHIFLKYYSNYVESARCILFLLSVYLANLRTHTIMHPSAFFYGLNRFFWRLDKNVSTSTFLQEKI